MLTSDLASGASGASGVRPVVGVDVGGTGMKGVVWAPDDGVRARIRRATPRGRGTPAIVDAILSLIDELTAAAGRSVSAVGLAVPGLVDETNGIATWSENLRWADVALRSLAQRHTDLPVWLGHDVRAGGVAEFRRGAARGARDAIFLPIGTGIGAALLLDGRSYDAGGFAGELGHADVGHGEPCACGAVGCLEAIASAGAIARRYNARASSQVPGAVEVVKRAQAGDTVAAKVWDDAIAALVLALSWVATVLAPEVVVIGGGLSLAGSFLFEPLEQRLAARLTFQRRPALVASTFGDEAACIGAAILAAELAESGLPTGQPRHE